MKLHRNHRKLVEQRKQERKEADKRGLSLISCLTLAYISTALKGYGTTEPIFISNKKDVSWRDVTLNNGERVRITVEKIL